MQDEDNKVSEDVKGSLQMQKLMLMQERRKDT